MNFEALGMDDVAALLRVTDRQVRTWIKDKGMPSRKDGRATTFIWSEVLDWYVEYKASLSRYAGETRSPKDPDQSNDPIFRKDAAVASLKELDLEQRQGQLVRMEDVRAVFNDVTKGMQVEVRGLPTRIVNQVLALRDRDEMFAYLSSETDNLLLRLTQLRFDASDAPPDDDDGD